MPDDVAADGEPHQDRRGASAAIEPLPASAGFVPSGYFRREMIFASERGLTRNARLARAGCNASARPKTAHEAHLRVTQNEFEQIGGAGHLDFRNGITHPHIRSYSRGAR
ncbi:MAG: hypothetical protein ABSC63_13860 [Candidatus Binataceae bacterium]|jgi:hypothetical protein